MPEPIKYWIDIYNRYKYDALCLDIECTFWNGPISVVGLYRPKEGIIESVSLIRGKNLSADSLKQEFKGCRLIITYNGLQFDVPHLKKEFQRTRKSADSRVIMA